MRRPDLTGNGGVATASTNGAAGVRKQKNHTGRYNIIFHEGACTAGITLMRSHGFEVFVRNPADPHIVRDDEVGDAEVLVRSTTETATAAVDDDKLALLRAWERDPNSPIKAVRPEKVRRIIPVTTQPASTGLAAARGTDLWPFPTPYFHYIAEPADEAPTAGVQPVTVSGLDESKTTWGLQALNVVDSPFSGRGVRVAVLDTGIDLDVQDDGSFRFHPDFEGRTITLASFVEGVSLAKDGNGHGTHCIGTACGPRQPAVPPGYGIAFEAHIFAGKVLNDEGRGADGWILDGIEWAINRGCRVISMSLGAPRELDDPFIQDYEDVAQRALKAGTVIIAAAGNDSRRPFFIEPVSGPADCPSIIAVAALDPQFRVAPFSNAGLNTNGGEINVAAPGVAVFSSFLGGGHERLNGTSMATPHVAGVAALLAEANPTATGPELSELLVNSVRTLALAQQDVGGGLIQAPQTSGLPILSTTPGFDVGIEQTSPITIGGGGSVGICVDTTHYKPQGTGGPRTRFVSTDRIEKLRIIDKFGGSIDRTPSTINCQIVVHTSDFDDMGNPIPNSDSPIVVSGNPLTVELNTADYPFGVPDGSQTALFFKLRRKLTGTVDVFENGATQPTAQHQLPTGGVCTIDVLNFP
jgi:subtilisin family serine protease